MFTGLVAGRGVVCDVRSDAAGANPSALVESSAWAPVDKPIRLTIRVPADFGGEGRLGESVCINGCCLTAVAFEGSGENWAFQAGSETLSKTNLGLIRPGDVVNLERALPVDGRFGGHFVQGHVDGVGHVDRTDRDGEWVTMWFRAPEPLVHQLVPKGSVAVDGVSLTVVNVERGRFSVALVPHTLEVTTLGIRKPGDSVNLETDILGKYVQKFLVETRPGEMKQGK
jgi:riboflavin synthase